MGRRIGISYTSLSQAAKGRQLPTLAVTLAFVRGCGGDANDERYWRQRWERVRGELFQLTSPAASDPPVDPLPVTTPPAGACPPPGKNDRSDGMRYFRLAAVLVITMAVLGSALVAKAYINGHVSMNAAADPAGLALIRPIADGQDPYINGCGHDQQPLERQPIYFKSGRFYGWIVLFYSKACSAAWGYVLGPNSPNWRVFIRAHRIGDNTVATSSFRGDARPNSWGNVLSTRSGCIRAEAWIDNGPRAVTSCWSPGGPVRRGTL
jgi:hypothetical protein